MLISTSIAAINASVAFVCHILFKNATNNLVPKFLRTKLFIPITISHRCTNFFLLCFIFLMLSLLMLGFFGSVVTRISFSRFIFKSWVLKFKAFVLYKVCGFNRFNWWFVYIYNWWFRLNGHQTLEFRIIALENIIDELNRKIMKLEDIVEKLSAIITRFK